MIASYESMSDQRQPYPVILVCESRMFTHICLTISRGVPYTDRTRWSEDLAKKDVVDGRDTGEDYGRYKI